jgi:hypothetical protein
MADKSTANEVQAVPVSSPQTPISSPAHKTSMEDAKHHHQHGHRHHDPRIIRPASSSTTHLDPGAINIKP